MKANLDRRVRILEDAFLRMSNDIGWIKKMGYFVISSPIVTEIIRHIWR